MTTGFTLRKPYLLFLGDAPDEAEAKTACGLRDWARDACKAQLRLPAAKLDLGLPDMRSTASGAAARAAYTSSRLRGTTTLMRSGMVLDPGRGPAGAVGRPSAG